jgi:hypothetical protein
MDRFSPSRSSFTQISIVLQRNFDPRTARSPGASSAWAAAGGRPFYDMANYEESVALVSSAWHPKRATEA